MKLLPLLLGVSSASTSLQILKEHVDGKDLPIVPQTQWGVIKEGDDFKFTAEVAMGGLENFIVISSADGKDWKGRSGYNYIANIRQGEAPEFYNDLYKERISFNQLSDKSIEVTISGEKGENSYMVLALGDVMSQNMRFDVSKNTYRANVYSGDLDLHYELVNGKPELVCTTKATGQADLTFDSQLTVKKDGSNTVRVEQPSSDWFSTNRNTAYITCKSPFAEAKVLSFKDATDAKMAGKSVLAGWTLTHECGPVPSQAANVRLLKGNQFQQDFVSFPIGGGSQDGITMTNNGDSLSFTGVKASSEMADAVMCAFRDAGDQIVGFTAPSKYDVFDQETPRLAVTAKFEQPECGFDTSAAEQQVGVCSTADAAGSFPPTLLQWEITKANGDVILQPSEPAEQSLLPLMLKLDQDLKGATVKCFDSRVGMSDSQQETVPTGLSGGITLKKHTSQAILTIQGSDQILCTSDAFPDDNDACTDVQEVLEPEITHCPATFKPMNATCKLQLKGGEIITSATYQNPDCIVDVAPLPCDKSSVDDCPTLPPPKAEEITAEAGGSLTWLFCFIAAAIGGAALIMLNKSKTRKDLSFTEDENSGAMSESSYPIKPPRNQAPPTQDVETTSCLRKSGHFTTPESSVASLV